MAARAPASLEIGKPIWGFDGKVLLSAFNLVSIEVSNRGGQPLEGDLVLDDASGAAPHHLRVFLGPGSSRWVQFYPYIGNYVPTWRLTWKDAPGGQGEDLGQPASGPPGTVLLGDPDAPGNRASRMRLFPENLFPPVVGATDGLEAVVLDHQPRWDAQRREAFLDWVRRGGVVHVIPGADGAPPQFTDALAPLDIPAGSDRARVGAGLVVRHEVSRAEITEQWLKERGFAQRELQKNDKGNVYDVDRFTFHRLAAITRPNINWGFIYLLTIIYIALIGPVFYILRKRNYRALLAGFLGTVALFAWLFAVVGRRGYGEKQISHSLAIAYPLGDGRFDVQEWIHSFATSSDIYSFQHPGGSHLYGTPSDGQGEMVRGEITVGKDAQFTVDIPLFSSRPFLHRGVMKTDDPALRVTHWEFKDKVLKDRGAPLSALRVEGSRDFRKRVFTAILEHGGRYSELAITEAGFELPAGGPSKPAAEYFGQNTYYDQEGSFGDAEAVARELRKLHPFYISRANGAGNYVRSFLPARPLGVDQARLFLFAEGPPTFGLQGDRFQTGLSLVLYVFDIFKP